MHCWVQLFFSPNIYIVAIEIRSPEPVCMPSLFNLQFKWIALEYI